MTTEEAIIERLKSLRELITLTLRELVARREHKDLVDVAGQLEFANDFDHKALRELRHGTD